METASISLIFCYFTVTWAYSVKNCTILENGPLVRQPGPSPFVIEATAGKLTPDRLQTVTLFLRPFLFLEPFQGFLLTIHRKKAKGDKDDKEPTGQFRLTDEEMPDGDVRVVDCGNKTGGGASHGNSLDKWMVKVKWVPPPGEGEYDMEITWISGNKIWLREKPEHSIHITASNKLLPFSYLENGSGFLLVVQIIAYTLVAIFLVLAFGAVTALYVRIPLQRQIARKLKQKASTNIEMQAMQTPVTPKSGEEKDVPPNLEKTETSV